MQGLLKTLIRASDPKKMKTKPLSRDEEIDAILLGELGEWLAEDEFIVTKPNWYKFYTIKTGFGYSENPLGAAFNPQSSSFTELNLESFF